MVNNVLLMWAGNSKKWYLLVGTIFYGLYFVLWNCSQRADVDVETQQTIFWFEKFAIGSVGMDPLRENDFRNQLSTSRSVAQCNVG